MIMNSSLDYPQTVIPKTSIFSVEMAYALFLFSGYIKQYLVFFGLLAVDFTLLVGGMLVCFSIYNLLSLQSKASISEAQFLGLSILLLFICSVLFSVIYTQSTSYFLSKSLNLGVCLLAYLFPIFYVGFNVQSFLRQFVNLSIVFALAFIIVFPFTYKFVGLESIQATYLVIGYLAGLNLLLLNSVTKRSRLVLVLFVVALLMSGARGALLFTAMTLLLLYVYRKLSSGIEIKPRAMFANGMIVFTLGLLVLNTDIGQSTIERTTNRVMVLFGDDGSVGSSAQIRINHIIDSIENIDERPILGYGLGSYSVVTTGLDMRAYPHNSILEVWFELGLAGLIAFTSMIVFHFLYVLKSVSFAATIVLMYVVLNSFVSSSFAELKIMFGLFSVFLILNAGRSKICSSNS